MDAQGKQNIPPDGSPNTGKVASVTPLVIGVIMMILGLLSCTVIEFLVNAPLALLGGGDGPRSVQTNDSPVFWGIGICFCGLIVLVAGLMRTAPTPDHTPELKLQAVLESLRGDTTQEEVCGKFGISSSLLQRWQQEFHHHQKATTIFSSKPDPKQAVQDSAPNVSADELKKIMRDLMIQNEILRKASLPHSPVHDPSHILEK